MNPDSLLRVIKAHVQLCEVCTDAVPCGIMGEYLRELNETPLERLERSRQRAVDHENTCLECIGNRFQPCSEGAHLRAAFWQLRREHPEWVPPTRRRQIT